MFNNILVILAIACIVCGFIAPHGDGEFICNAMAIFLLCVQIEHSIVEEKQRKKRAEREQR